VVTFKQEEGAIIGTLLHGVLRGAHGRHSAVVPDQESGLRSLVVERVMPSLTSRLNSGKAGTKMPIRRGH
ncbi:hypothetical protein, partial [Pseudomonas viridiflava]|uniref:hypothetical protein n=1 Tax=Pseudomonas viridiflava TaxID=33069 RepID=UPI0019803FCD